MDKKLHKKICKCPRKNQKTCKHSKTVERTELAEIVEALTYDNPTTCKGIPCGAPKLKMGPAMRHYKDTCVPMAPSMHTRLRYIGHCPIETPRTMDEKARNKAYSGIDDFEDEEACGILTCPRRKKCRKKVRYFDLDAPNIVLPLPSHVVKHTDSNKSILNVGSPKTSGEFIQAQKTVLKLQDQIPPLPGKSGHELFKPHSGLVINRQGDFVPDVVHAPGPKNIPRPQKAGEVCGKSTKCHMGSSCGKSTCRKKKCRRIAKLRKKQTAKRIRMRNRAHLDSFYTKLGATDGKPRGNAGKPVKEEDSVCGLDDITKPEHVRIPPNLKRGTFETHSLTVVACHKDKKAVHYGILTGSFNMYDNKFGARSRGRQALTMSAMAYCLAFHYHPKQWTMKLIDNLIEAGDQWFLQCADKVHDHSSVQGVCEVLPFGKKQTLVLNRKRMQMLLGEPEVVGYTMSLDPTVYNLCRGLKAFFKENRAGILLTRVLKLVVWKDKVCYYIFDPAGRDSKAYSNYTTGTAALINVKDLESVAEVLLARSVVEDQKFVLAPLKVLKMIDENDDDDLESDKELTLAEKAMMGYRILNENCAIVNANMHLGDRCFEDAKYRQALPVAVMAMTYAKISPPNTWHTKTLDKILRLGNKLFVDCSNPKVMIDMTIDNIPNSIVVGPYACEIIIYRDRVKGQLFTTKECLFNIKTGLRDFFSKEYNSGILQFNNYSMAVWRQKDMYYLFDPYPRTADGLTSIKVGKACVLMLLNPDTMANSLIKNWEYLPTTTQFSIHSFKVLKLRKKDAKLQILCTLSDEQLPGKKVNRQILPESLGHGDFKELMHDVLPMEILESRPLGPQADEEQMGDIVSLVDSIQEDYLPAIPLRYKKAGAEPFEPRIVNLDSPTVSVTQVVPPWPKPRDKSGEQPDLDPEPEPEPEPEPPPPPVPEGFEEEELGEEEEAERRRKEEEKKRLEEEEKKKALELPPPIPPPPPSPQPEPELASPPLMETETKDMEDEIQTIEPVAVDRRILLAEDARYRHKLREQRRKMSLPLAETQLEISPSQELVKPHNFKKVLDGTEIIKGGSAINDNNIADVLPFVAIMAIVTSYKYSINTWTVGIVNFVIESAKKLFQNKQQKFQFAPMHIIPKIALGHQAFQANIDVVGEGPTWQLEDILARKFFSKYDRGMITTTNYSCAIFKKNGLYYLYDGSPCNPLGLRNTNDTKQTGKAAFMRFKSLHGLVNRVIYNKDGTVEDQQFILSRIVVRRLLKEPRSKLPDDYDFASQMPKGKKSKITIVQETKQKSEIKEEEEQNVKPVVGYQFIEGLYRIEGTTGLKSRGCGGSDVKACHFISLIAMLMAAMHPIRTWDHFMIDTAVEKGVEIHEKATNCSPCEKRVIKNIILDGKFININIKKLIVINENSEKTLEQYIKAVSRRLRYVIVRFPQCSFVICQVDGYYHFFDCYPPPSGEDKMEPPPDKKDEEKMEGVASWTLYRSIESVISRLRKTIFRDVDNPEFYTFELTSVKTAPRHSALNYRLSPLFKPDENPNLPYLKRRRVRPIVDEKMYWLSVEQIPWSRMNPLNDLGFERMTPQAVWKDWDIEFPGDLYSLWGTIHPRDARFPESHQGKQILATCTVALAVSQCCELSAWNANILDGIVIAGDKYHKNSVVKKASGKTNYEVAVTDLDTKFDDMYPYSFSVKFDKAIFGFVYNMYPDRFNLSKALSYFFEKNNLGILVSPSKNLAFGKAGPSYFMFDCQSYGAPIFVPGQGSAYVLKCESLNRLIYCITMTLNIRRHGAQFHLFSAVIALQEKSK